MLPLRHFLFFDSDCPFCQLQIKLLAKLDWLNKVNFVPLQDFKKTVKGVNIDENVLNQAIHCITPQKNIFVGAKAIRFVGMRIPLLIPLSLFLWLPGMMFIAEKIYQSLSANRYFLSRFLGCKEACSVNVTKNKKSDA